METIVGTIVFLSIMESFGKMMFMIILIGAAYWLLGDNNSKTS